MGALAAALGPVFLGGSELLRQLVSAQAATRHAQLVDARKRRNLRA